MRFLAVCAFITCLFSTVVNASEWTKLSSDNFEFYGQYEEENARKRLEQFEIMRAVVFDMLQLDKSKTLVPARIIAFSSKSDFLDIAPSDKVGGFYVISGNKPTLVVGPYDRRELTNATLYHEYIHYLIRAASPMSYPIWYDEGLAMFYGSMKIGSDYVTLGSKYNSASYSLRKQGLMPLDTLFSHNTPTAYTTDDFRWQLYSSAWLAVHFFTLGELNGADNYSAALSKLLQLHNQGTPANEAIKQAFGDNFAELEQQVRKHSKKKRLRLLQLPIPEVDANYNVAPVKSGEMDIVFSQLTYGRQPEKSEAFLQQALAQKYSLAYAYKANNLARDGEIEEAQQFIDQALDLANDDPLTLLHVSKAYLNLADFEPENAGVHRQVALALISKSAKQEVLPATLITLAELQWQTGQKQAAIDSIVSLIQLAPSDTHANFVAAKYMVMINQKDYARKFLTNVINWSHNQGQVDRAEQKLASLD